MAKTYFKFAICLVLLTSLECRVIKIVEEAEDSNDVIVKIIIKHAKKNTHTKLNRDHGVETSEKKDINDMENKATVGLSYNNDEGKDDETEHHKVDKFELPDNLFEDLEDTPNKQSSSEEDLQEKPVSEPLPSFHSRSGIAVGYCPTGYIRTGRLCLPANK